jgi:hypothetical protein
MSPDSIDLTVRQGRKKCNRSGKWSRRKGKGEERVVERKAR